MPESWKLGDPLTVAILSRPKDNSIEFVASSVAQDPGVAVNEALTEILRKLIAAGGASHHLTAMVWETGNPGGFHPSRRSIDLACREALLGFRPPLTVAWRHGENLTIRARATITASDTKPVYGPLTLPDLSREFSLRSQVQDISSVFSRWSKWFTLLKGSFRSRSDLWTETDRMSRSVPPECCCPAAGLDFLARWLLAGHAQGTECSIHRRHVGCRICCRQC